MQNFELQFWDVGGCVGYPLSSKSILKVVSQMVRLCDYATVFFSYLHIDFLTFLALLKNTSWDGTPCTMFWLTMYWDSILFISILLRKSGCIHICMHEQTMAHVSGKQMLLSLPIFPPYSTLHTAAKSEGVAFSLRAPNNHYWVLE